jgi:hypothetical protein
MLKGPDLLGCSVFRRRGVQDQLVASPQIVRKKVRTRSAGEPARPVTTVGVTAPLGRDCSIQSLTARAMSRQ